MSRNNLLLLFIITFITYSCKYMIENRENLLLQGISEFFEVEIVRKYNSDPLPNRTDTRTAYEMCSNYSNYYCVPPLRNYNAVFRIAPKYNISTCVVQKSMSSVMTAIFCLLYDEDGFRQSGRELLKGLWSTRFCKGRNEAASMISPQWRLLVPSEDGWMHTMVTREPVNRFLSGFVHICIRKPMHKYCNGCKANMTCFIITEYERMVAQAKKGNFERTREDTHFFPQNWRCELFRNPNRNFIRYSSNVTDTLLDDLFKVLKIQNVGLKGDIGGLDPLLMAYKQELTRVDDISSRVKENETRVQLVQNSTLDFIRNELTLGRTAHSTIQSYARKYLEERLRSSDFLMDYIVRMFYHDFRILHYELPDGFR